VEKGGANPSKGRGLKDGPKQNTPREGITVVRRDERHWLGGRTHRRGGVGAKFRAKKKAKERHPWLPRAVS